MTVDFFHIDAFSHRRFEGNPAAVCLLDARLEELLEDGGWAQQVAAEMNLSETAFVGPPDNEGCRPLRWFTPEVEVDLCGHATLAAAHALWEAGQHDAGETIRFSTRSGLLEARQKSGAHGVEIALDFPASSVVRCSWPDDLAVALGVMPLEVGKTAQNDYLIEVGSVAFVLDLQPDIALLRTIAGRGFIVTAAVRPGDDSTVKMAGLTPDFVSRFFAPACGVDEDPVTGSAHCALATYWARRLKKSGLLAYQASPRGGFVGLQLLGERVVLAGGAVTVVVGRLNL